jgi:hypothetical protein
MGGPVNKGRHALAGVVATLGYHPSAYAAESHNDAHES